ncbi:DUF5694 domain-containing protein [Hymenobacter jejuensis]|uniref:Uncharacterized protein n=1 Tax=Hymenobacter jejuensis TaxID=2502781 RepID=A0A5B7ZVG5_9BACT|nr:DUF5694 domain-containing protein [Hymenobacter jejuensis]QDA58837.1 hypothetical protein FHG12_01420 [Hymenobacter jejuensis]
MHKRLFLLWLLVCGVAGPLLAQKPLEVIIVGTSHYNGSPDSSYRPIINKLKAYRPDIVFGEYLSAADAQQLPADQSVAVPFQRRMQYMKRRELTTAPLTPKAAASARRQLRKKPLLHRQRIDLARYYASTYDRGNAEYQLYLLEEPFKTSLSPADRAYYSQAFGPADSLRKTARLVRPLTEYHRIFFPLLHELGQDQIYPMDCQRYDQAWNKASGEAYTQFVALQAGFKKDSATAEAATFRRISTAKPAYFAYLNASNSDEEVYRAMNKPIFGTLSDNLNFFGDESLDGAVGFPTQAVRAMKAQWALRNQGMCDNIVRLARQQGATKVMVAVGSAHTMILQRLLTQMPNVHATTFDDLP